MSPLYEKDTDAEGNPHVIWYHSTYPEAAADADDATNSYLDDTIVCTETAYSDTQYEKSWFTAATGEIHNDGEYYYYVAGELESYADVGQVTIPAAMATWKLNLIWVRYITTMTLPLRTTGSAQYDCSGQ